MSIDNLLFLSAVDAEITRARQKHPGNAHLMVALIEEVGELGKALLEKESPNRVYAEAVQVACVAARIATEGDADFMLPGWIPCNQQLPDADTTVMTLAPGSDEPIWPGYLDGTGWYNVDGTAIDDSAVTHWMPFPEPPEGLL